MDHPAHVLFAPIPVLVPVHPLRVPVSEQVPIMVVPLSLCVAFVVYLHHHLPELPFPTLHLFVLLSLGQSFLPLLSFVIHHPPPPHHHHPMVAWAHLDLSVMEKDVPQNMLHTCLPCQHQLHQEKYPKAWAPSSETM